MRNYLIDCPDTGTFDGLVYMLDQNCKHSSCKKVGYLSLVVSVDLQNDLDNFLKCIRIMNVKNTTNIVA